MVRDKADPKKETEMSIFQYYNEKYNVRLEKWGKSELRLSVDYD